MVLFWQLHASIPSMGGSPHSLLSSFGSVVEKHGLVLAVACFYTFHGRLSTFFVVFFRVSSWKTWSCSGSCMLLYLPWEALHILCCLLLGQLLKNMVLFWQLHASIPSMGGSPHSLLSSFGSVVEKHGLVLAVACFYTFHGRLSTFFVVFFRVSSWKTWSCSGSCMLLYLPWEALHILCSLL